VISTILAYFAQSDRMNPRNSAGVKMIADELPYRERQLTFHAPGLCEWGQNPTFPNFGTERENDASPPRRLQSGLNRNI
jgi:hypothetical protein